MNRSWSCWEVDAADIGQDFLGGKNQKANLDFIGCCNRDSSRHEQRLQRSNGYYEIIPTVFQLFL